MRGEGGAGGESGGGAGVGVAWRWDLSCTCIRYSPVSPGNQYQECDLFDFSLHGTGLTSPYVRRVKRDP